MRYAQTVRGRAWVGEGQVERVEISSDEGKTWQRAKLDSGDTRRARYDWRAIGRRLNDLIDEASARAPHRAHMQHV